MGGSWEKWEQKGKRFFMAPILRIPFYIFTLTLLSLVLPLSFLLLARLSTAQYPCQPPPPSFILSLFLNLNPALLQSLLSFVSVTGLVHALTGQFTLLNGSNLQPHLHIAWLFLCVLQVSVGLGIEAIVVGSALPEDYGTERRSMVMSRIVFFIGLYETMLHWSRTVVRPVVDDTVLGVSRVESWIEKVAVSASFGALWLWRLRDEIEALVLVVEIKRELLIGFGMSDFINWWLYYLTVTIGLVRLVKGFIWFWKVLLCRRPEHSLNSSSRDDDDDDKV